MVREASEFIGLLENNACASEHMTSESFPGRSQQRVEANGGTSRGWGESIASNAPAQMRSSANHCRPRNRIEKTAECSAAVATIRSCISTLYVPGSKIDRLQKIRLLYTQ